VVNEEPGRDQGAILAGKLDRTRQARAGHSVTLRTVRQGMQGAERSALDVHLPRL